MRRPLAVATTVLNLMLAAATVVLVSRGYVDIGDHLPAFGGLWWLVQASLAVAWAVPGGLMAWRRPEVPFGWLALAAGLGHGLAGAGIGWVESGFLSGNGTGGAALGLWLAAWGEVVELPVLFAIYVLFPYGRTPPGWLGRIGLATIAMSVGAVVASATAPLAELDIDPNSPLGGLHNPLGFEIAGASAWAAALLPIAGIVNAAVLLLRWRRALGEERQVLRWLGTLTALTPVIVVSVLFLPYGAVVAQAITFLEILTVTAVVLRHRLFGVEVVLNRALVYALLTAALAVVYALVVGVGGAMIPEGPSSFVGAMVVALAVAPARGWLQRGVNRFMYGDRDDPYAVVSKVSAQLSAAASADDLLAGVVRAVSDGLRLPYAAIRLTTENEPLVIESGAAPAGAATESFDLRHQGEVLGVLVVAVRSGESEFRAAERRLLERLADQAAVAASAVSLTLALQRSRERLVVAREEERRRLRRDLHDGLGPTLTACAFSIDTARTLVESDPATADELLAAVRAEVSAAIDDIRRLVYGLRPPALDELGLVGALNRYIARLDGGSAGLVIDVETPDPLPALPAAIEVAAFRIATEAVTNAVRHSGASRCTVRIRSDGQLTIDVADDGSGAGEWLAGVGLSSMRERAAEVGGVCLIGPRADGGGLVSARLPLRT